LDSKTTSEKNTKKTSTKKEILKKENTERVMPTIDFSVDDSIKMLKNDLDFESDGYYGNQMGADEVGVGDYFGPIVTCAAYVESKNMENL
jgi:ribonuclease HIII